MITCRAPGKLFLAGEYAVLHAGHPAVLVAVDRYVTVMIDESHTTVLQSDISGGIELQCHRVDNVLVPVDDRKAHEFAHVLSAISVVETLLAEQGRTGCEFRLEITSTLHDRRGRKLGLGSSGAVTVATIAALCRFHRLALDRMQRYRLAMLSLVAMGSSGSGGDLAASTWGGWLTYRAPDHRRLRAVLDVRGVGVALQAPWPGLAVHMLNRPTTVQLAVGWTGLPASSDAILSGRSTDDLPVDFLVRSNLCVIELISAIEADDGRRISTGIRYAGELLRDLDTKMELGIFTRQLETLCAIADSIGAVAKPSGAGGGDCGIALLDADAGWGADALNERWSRAGIQPLHLNTADAEES